MLIASCCVTRLANYLLLEVCFAKLPLYYETLNNKKISICLFFLLVLQPGIAFLCDPDTINNQLVLHLHRRQMMKKDYAYAASYEDFVSLIEDCDDLEELRQIR